MKNGSGYLTPKTINENKVGSKGLYDPTFEHDSCGIGFLANLDGRQENIIIEHALTISEDWNIRVAVVVRTTQGMVQDYLYKSRTNFSQNCCGIRKRVAQPW